jgi:hypothetical protein
MQTTRSNFTLRKVVRIQSNYSEHNGAESHWRSIYIEMALRGELVVSLNRRHKRIRDTLFIERQVISGDFSHDWIVAPYQGR